MIKPSDIPDDLAEYVCTFADLSPKQGKGMVAAILNAAIEAGVVSPPVFCVRQNGELRKFDSGEVKVFPGKPWANDTEHWKGQTS